jgi:dTMP kinase
VPGTLPAVQQGALRLPPLNGRFVTLEGPEGAGKTAIARRLVGALEARGTAVLLTREPGGTRLGERLREILLAADGETLGPRTDALLFNAARAQLVAEIIGPALDAGEVVVCARFADSTLAYQGYGAGVPLGDLRALAEIATGGLEPDLTLLLDVAPEIGLRRKAEADRTRFEASFDLAFHRRVRAGFLELAAAEPDRFRVVDSARPLDKVFGEALEAVLEIL